MKFNCGETWSTKQQRLQEWHEWFAWHPIRLGDHDCRWLEKVQRKGTLCWGGWIDSWWYWDYKAIENPCNKCNNTGWVCECHPDKEAHKCCGGAGMPCECTKESR